MRCDLNHKPGKPQRLNRLVAISGCSGGVKSTLLVELACRGFATVEEPGRRIMSEALGSIEIAALEPRSGSDRGAAFPRKCSESLTFTGCK